MNWKILTAIIGISLMLAGTGLAFNEFQEPDLEGRILDEEADLDILAEYPHCHQEQGEWYCYQLKATTLPMRFQEDIECFIREEALDNYQESGNCYTTIEITEEAKVNASLLHIKTPNEYERIKREEQLEEGKEIEAIVSPEAIDYEKCTEPEFNESIVIRDIYKTECSYQDQDYTGNVSYYGSDNFIAIHEMNVPVEEPFRIPLPSLPVLILVILIIATVIWILYPDIEEKIKKIKK